MHQVEQYWVLAAFCGAVMVLLLRLVVRERVTLQSSLSLSALLVALIAVALFPDVVFWVTRRLGFVLPSNLLFAMGIGALALLNVATLVTLSRVELRSIALTQELGLLREKLDRVATQVEASPQPRPGRDAASGPRPPAG
jgi:hypothetical protein